MRRSPLAVVLSALVVSSCAAAPLAPATRPVTPSTQAAPVTPSPQASPATLHDGTPESAGLAPQPIVDAQRQIARWTQQSHPLYAGAVSLLAHNGVIVSRQAAGDELRYADGRGTELPAQQQEPVTTDTIFDLASLTKLFTSISVMQLVEQGRIQLDTPVAGYVPEFATGGKAAITVEQLLTHTSGLPGKIELWRLPAQQRLSAALGAAPQTPPGRRYLYSDLNMIALGVLVQRVSGKPLDQVIHDRITGPLGMTDTGFDPPASKLHRIAATEFETDPPRGMVRGQVHDENAWALGGVAGEAGMFSTADDLAVLGQTLLNGGGYNNVRILRPETVQAMLSNHVTLPGGAHGLGFELDQRWYMADLGAHAAGHTGFTGTSLVIDPASDSIVILLTNAVHPLRTWGSANPARHALAQGMSAALGSHRA
jgi:CubicO group peptidase (beta-lactamase class C family)